MTNRFICVKAVGIFMKNVNENHTEMYMLNFCSDISWFSYDILLFS